MYVVLGFVFIVADGHKNAYVLIMTGIFFHLLDLFDGRVLPPPAIKIWKASIALLVAMLACLLRSTSSSTV